MLSFKKIKSSIADRPSYDENNARSGQMTTHSFKNILKKENKENVFPLSFGALGGARDVSPLKVRSQVESLSEKRGIRDLSVNRLRDKLFSQKKLILDKHKVASIDNEELVKMSIDTKTIKTKSGTLDMSPGLFTCV